MFRPTRRRSGHMHATIRVPFYPDRQILVNVTAATLFFEVDAEPGVLSKRRVEDAVRDLYANHGGAAGIIAGDNLDEIDEDGIREEALDWADGEIHRLWPEWSR